MLNRSLIIFLLVFFLAMSLTHAPKDISVSKPIFLKAKTITSQEAINKQDLLQSRKSDIYLLQFAGPINHEWKQELSDIGVVFYSYVPEFTFIAKIPSSKINIVLSKDFVSRISDYKPEYKLSPKFNKKQKFSMLEDKKLTLDISTFEESKGLSSEIEDIGADIIHDNGKTIRVRIDESKIREIAQLEDVAWIEETPIYKIFNDKAAVVVGANHSWSNLGLSGSGQIIAVSDSGLDTGIDNNSVVGDIHLDFDNRVNVIYDVYESSSSPDDINGHGTHVAGSVLGNGSESNTTIRGMAYDAELVFQAIGDDAGSDYVYPPSDLRDLFSQALNANATIHTNSWGVLNNSYTDDAQEIDDFIWNNTNFTILFAAGNDGPNTNTVGAPATAKNAITVGASENNRSDKDSSADNINEIASFSSRGPTADNRIKPDLVAPGTFILSTRVNKSVKTADPCSSWGSYNDYYTYCSGSSMSTPIVAGVVALLRQYFVENESITPSASLLKAALINGADDMGMTIPNNNSGWGRVNLTNFVDPPQKTMVVFVDHRNGLNTSETTNYSYTVESSDVQFKATLVWTDYPSTPAASKNLVNDLNLIITSPNNTKYFGNDFTAPYNTSFDNTNNVEQVIISTPENGTYNITVNASNIAQGTQHFSLVITLGDEIAPNVTLANPTPDNLTTSNVTIYINATATDTHNITACYLEWNYTNETITKSENGSSIYCFKNKSIVGSGLFYYKIWAKDSAKNWGDSELRWVNVTNTAPNITSYTPNTTSVSVAENSSLQFNHTSTDVNNDTLTYNWTLNKTTQSTNASWLYQPNFTAAGQYNVTLFVSDGQATVSQYWNLTVNNTNRVPVFDSYYPSDVNISIVEPNNQTFNITTTEPDGEDITIKWLFNSTNISDSYNYTFLGNYSSAGTYNITVILNDSTDTSSRTWLLTVNDTNTAPVLGNISNITVNESDLVNINATGELTATDVEDINLVFNFTSPLNSSGMWQTTYRNSGTYVVTVTVSDGSLTDTQNVTITVLEIEDNDNDGLNDSLDFVFGNSSSINTTLTNISLLINGTSNITKQFNGSFTVNITNGTKSLLEFEWNFSNSSLLNFSKITVNKQSNTSTKGSIIINGLNLTSQNQTKTVYIDDLDSGISTLCLKDAEITNVISNISSSCNEQNESLITCDGTLQANKYNCTSVDNSSRYKIKGISYSGVIEQCADSDADGYYVSGCTGGNDCNDNNANANPGTSEVCGDNLDNDCDGSVDEGCDSGGGGGGGGVAVTITTGNKETKQWFSIEKDTTKIMKITKTEIAFNNLSISVRNKLRNAKIIVEKLDEKPENISEPPKKVYQYIVVNKSNVKDEDIRKVDIIFKVEKEWLSNNSVDKENIVLMKFVKDKWKGLITDYIIEDDNYFYYKSIAGTFSYFAISFKEEKKQVVKKKPPETAIVQKVKENITEAKNITKPKENITTEEPKEKEPIPKTQPFGYLLTALLIIFGILYYYDSKFGIKKKKTRKKKK